MYEQKHSTKTRGSLYTTNQVRNSFKQQNHLHVGLPIRELMSADEFMSPVETFASDARTRGSLLEYPIPFDAKLRSDIRFFFAGDFKLRPPAPGFAATGADALSPRYADSSSACAGGRRLERRRAFSMRSGPMFERRRETFTPAEAERGVVGSGRSAGPPCSLRRSAAALWGRGRGGRCTPPLIPPPPLPLPLLDCPSSANEFRLRSASARLSVLMLPTASSSSSLRLPRVDDAPRDLRKPGSRRLPRRVRGR